MDSCWSSIGVLALLWNFIYPTAARTLSSSRWHKIPEYCPPYNNSAGERQDGFYCPETLSIWGQNSVFCCGTKSDTKRFCCHITERSLFHNNESKELNLLIQYWPYLAVVAIAGYLFLLVRCIKGRSRNSIHVHGT